MALKKRRTPLTELFAEREALRVRPIARPKPIIPKQSNEKPQIKIAKTIV